MNKNKSNWSDFVARIVRAFFILVNPKKIHIDIIFIKKARENGRF